MTVVVVMITFRLSQGSLHGPKDLCDFGFKATIIGSKGRSSSFSCSQITEEGRAGWCVTLNRGVLGGRVLLGCGVSRSVLSPKEMVLATLRKNSLG